MSDDTIVIGKPDLPKIDVLYAYIATGEDGEGLCGYQQNDGAWIPMVGANIARHKFLRQRAQEIATKTGLAIKLVKFSVREEIETIEP